MIDHSGSDLPLRENCDPRFPTRVALGTLVGVMTCLLFACMLILMYWLRTGSNGNSLTGDGNGNGTGTGHLAGDGTASVNDANGVADVNRDGDPDASDSATGDHQSSETEELTQKEDAGHGDQTAQSDNGEESGTEPAAAKKKSERESYVIAPLEDLGKVDPGQEEPGKPVAARPPGMFSGRNAEARKKLAASEGGTEGSEAAVELGLSWMAKHQDKDGHWSLHEFNHTGDCDRQCADAGANSDVAATGFGLLPFLGAGYTHKTGKYKSTVKKGLDWLIEDQQKDGTFTHCHGEGYAQGIGSMALCEAYAMTKDPSLKTPAQRAVEFIARAQHKGGGWRYSPGDPGDTSVTGWQVIALRSAQQGGLQIPKQVFPKLNQYLDSVQTDPKGGGYSYMPLSSARTLTMTAEGLLCRIYSSWNTKRPGLEAGVQYLMTHPPKENSEFYYWYYATQVLHHHGGKPWQEWNVAMRELLITLQEKDGHETGSWDPVGGHDVSGGRIYTTSLALLTLEVYYRHKRAYE